MEVIRFTKIDLPFGWLGNMSRHSVIYEGVEWRTAEALFQALRFDKGVIRDKIREQKSPIAAKMVAKHLDHVPFLVVQPLSEQDVANMSKVIRLKIGQHPELKRELLGTGDATIIEDVTKRARGGNHLFWGAAYRQGEWVGKNVLGKLWVVLRNELRERNDTK